MARLDELLQNSIDRYQLIMNEMLKLSGDVEMEGLVARAFTESIAQLQADAARADEEVLAVLSEGHVVDHPLIQQRLQLIEKIVEQNRLISSQAHGIMAVVSAELSQLRDGRAVVSGYAPNQETRGKRVREAC